MHSLRVAEGNARDAARHTRERVVTALQDPQRNFDNALGDLEDGVRHEAHRAEEAVASMGAKAKQALSPSASRGRDTPPNSTADAAQEDGDEEWMSDGEGDSARPESSAQGEARRQSRSPKLKPPKLAMLRPAPGGRRRSIRRGMLGNRVFGRHQDDAAAAAPPEPHMSRVREQTEPRGAEDQDQRGRRPVLVDRPSVRLMHHRVDSLRSIDERSRRSLREASPARSIRWADTPPDVASVYGGGTRSGTTTPGILSPSSPITPLPGSEAPSDNEDGSSPNTPTYQVRFDVPTTPGGGHGHHHHHS